MTTLAPELHVERWTRASRIGAGVAALVALFLASFPFWATSDAMRLVVQFACLLAIAQMWNLLAGYGGLVSIGQQAFIGIGGYSLFVLANGVGINPFLCVLLGGIVAALLAIPTSRIVFGLSGGYFAVATWVVAEVYRLLVANVSALGGGSGESLTALIGISKGTRESATFWIAIALLVATTGGVYALLRTRLGLALTAVRDSAVAAESQGVDVASTKLIVYVLAAFGSGCAGALYFLSALRISPDAAFGADWIPLLFFTVVIGGIGTIEGPIVGTLLYFVLRQYFADYGAWYLIALGLLAIVIMIRFPRGIWRMRRTFRMAPLSHSAYFARGKVNARSATANTAAVSSLTKLDLVRKSILHAVKADSNLPRTRYRFAANAVEVGYGEGRRSEYALIQAQAQASNLDVRSQTLAVHSLDHFALAVPDLAIAEKFYTTFGLKVANVADGLEIHAAQGTIANVREAPGRRLDYISLNIDADDLKPFQQRLEAGRIALLDRPHELPGDGLWFRDPDGVLVEVMVRERRSPTTKGIMDVRLAPEGVRRAQAEIGKKTVPRRLGHVLRFSPDVLRAVDFYERFLGMRLSDRSGDIIAFMHSPHGSDHHVLAFAKSSRPGFHHASFEVDSIDAIGLGATNMMQGGYGDGWGVGRHEAGSNFFYYVRDPWGSFAEYFCDMDYIPADCGWEARDVPGEHALSLWSPIVPGYFLENHESEL